MAVLTGQRVERLAAEQPQDQLLLAARLGSWTPGPPMLHPTPSCLRGRVRRDLALALFASVGVVFAGFVAGTALAGHWLNGDAYKAGDKNVYFHQCDMADNTHEAFHDNNGHDIAPTAIDPSTPHGCSVTDVQIHDDSHQNSSWYGLYRCFDFHSPNVCDKAYIHINTKFQQIPEKYLFTLGIVCEEVGHSVGLGHRGSEGTCMKDPTRALDRDHLDGHDKDAINNNY